MMDRRDFLKLGALGGGAVFISGLYGAALADAGREDFYFVQLSDSHWGYKGPANPDAQNTLKQAVASVNALETPPEFIVFTGDLTHTTDDPAERRRRMAEFKDIVAGLNVKKIHFLPGEHDASLDNGAAFQEFFGPTHYSFDHKGVHFIAIDNVSDPGARIGEAQLAWLKADLAAQPREARIVVITHRPLFDLAPTWDWATRDGAQAIELLMAYPNVTVFYGHIHQENHHMTGHIAHHAARSLIFPLPAPGSQEKRTPLPWDASAPGKGLGFREIAAQGKGASFQLVELSLAQPAGAQERVVKIEARKFRYSPNLIELKKGEAVVLELTAVDFPHGFSLPDFQIREDLVMGKTVRVKLKPETAGRFGFLCDNFCGSGHEEMAGTIVVKA